MAKSHDSFGKRETEKRKAQKRMEKEQRREERKSQGGGKSLDDMIAYVDENGNITSTPPDPARKKEISAEDIVISVARQSNLPEEPSVRSGVVTFFNNSKGYGFIRDINSQESIFVHINDLTENIRESDKVTFETRQGFKGPQAFNVTIIR